MKMLDVYFINPLEIVSPLKKIFKKYHTQLLFYFIIPLEIVSLLKKIFKKLHTQLLLEILH